MSSSDELKVPSQRSDDPDNRDNPDNRDYVDSVDDPRDVQDAERAGDGRAREGDRHHAEGEFGGRERGDLVDEEGDEEGDKEGFARSEQTTVPGPGPVVEQVHDGNDHRGDDEERGRTQSPRADDEYVAAVPGAVVTPSPADEDAPYRDPYARTGGDMLVASEPEPGAAVGAERQPDPAHAAPEDVALFDQDPAQVQARWRDVQASFVDDPGEAVQRADGLVGEVVESLTGSLNSRTNALRERWKESGASDTEQLRLALRDYRNVLERLLALSSAQPGRTVLYGPGQRSDQRSDQPGQEIR